MNKNVLIGFCGGLFFCCACCCISFTLLAATGEVSDNNDLGNNRTNTFESEFSDLDGFRVYEGDGYTIDIHDEYERTSLSKQQDEEYVLFSHKRRNGYEVEIKTQVGEFISELNETNCTEFILLGFSSNDVIDVELVDDGEVVGCYFEVYFDRSKRMDMYLLTKADDIEKESKKYYSAKVVYHEGGNLDVLENLQTTLDSFKIVE